MNYTSEIFANGKDLAIKWGEENNTMLNVLRNVVISNVNVNVTQNFGDVRLFEDKYYRQHSKPVEVNISLLCRPEDFTQVYAEKDIKVKFKKTVEELLSDVISNLKKRGKKK